MEQAVDMLLSVITILGQFNLSTVGFQQWSIFSIDVFDKSLSSTILLFKWMGRLV